MPISIESEVFGVSEPARTASPQPKEILKYVEGQKPQQQQVPEQPTKPAKQNSKLVRRRFHRLLSTVFCLATDERTGSSGAHHPLVRSLRFVRSVRSVRSSDLSICSLHWIRPARHPIRLTHPSDCTPVPIGERIRDMSCAPSRMRLTSQTNPLASADLRAEPLIPSIYL